MAFGCASTQEAPRSADLIIPEWTKPPASKPTQHETHRIEAGKPNASSSGEVVGDTNSRGALSNTSSYTNFSHEADSTFYGGCGSLNGGGC
jgi:hypothetical protein